ncbi:MAG: glycosyltransferase, partial [Gemmatimonadota bacterium]
MKVIHIATAFPRREDDPITPWLGTLLLSLRDRGLEVEVLAPAYRGSRTHRWHGLTVHRFRYAPRGLETLTHDETAPDRLRHRPAYALLLPSYLAAGCLAAARLGARRPDVVHVHWPMPHALAGTALRAASAGHTA